MLVDVVEGGPPRWPGSALKSPIIIKLSEGGGGW